MITDSDTLKSLARRWAQNLAGGGSPGLTNADIAAIAASDVFPNSSYVLTVPSGSTCSADARFCLTDNMDVAYVPPAQGGQPITEKYSEISQATAQQGQTAINTHNVGFSFDLNASGGFLVDFNIDLKVSNTLTWTNKWSALDTQSEGQAATLTVTGPAYSDNYTGPKLFGLYQDNVYGTFMFYPVN